MKCPNCNEIYDDEFNFCPHCGLKKPEGKICPVCEYLTCDEEFMFCPECGEKLISKNEHKEILEKNRIEELRKEEEKRKNELKRIVENAGFGYTITKLNLLDKIDRGEILSEDELKKVIDCERIRKELIKLVEASSIKYDKKEVLKKRITDNIITDKNQLFKEIEKEMKKEKEENKKIYYMISYKAPVYQDDYEDKDSWEETKKSDEWVTDSSIYSKDDYEYGDVDYEDDPDKFRKI